MRGRAAVLLAGLLIVSGSGLARGGEPHFRFERHESPARRLDTLERPTQMAVGLRGGD